MPVTFDEDAVIEWTPVWSLTHRAPRYLPTAFCYFNYPLPDDAAFCRSCSNGNAGGNTLEEAILQGFLELAERDSVALWWYSRVRRPAVDLASFDEPYLDRLGAFLRARRRDLWVLDLTSDLEIPTFAAVSRRTDRQPEDLLFGFGAHLDPRIAVLRAVTELNQFLDFFARRQRRGTGPTARRRQPRSDNGSRPPRSPTSPTWLPIPRRPPASPPITPEPGVTT